MPFDATVGGAASTSYVTVEAAWIMLEGRLHIEPWAEAQLDRKEVALRWATHLLETQVAWQGTPASTTQALAWPQQGQVDRWGRAIPVTVIPQAIQQATALYALALLRDTSEDERMAVAGRVRSRSMGDLSITYQSTWTPATWSRIPTEVRDLLAPYGTVAHGINVPLLRT